MLWLSELPTTGLNFPVSSIVCQALTPTWSSRVQGPFQISIASTVGNPKPKPQRLPGVGAHGWLAITRPPSERTWSAYCFIWAWVR